MWERSASLTLRGPPEPDLSTLESFSKPDDAQKVNSYLFAEGGAA